MFRIRSALSLRIDDNCREARLKLRTDEEQESTRWEKEWLVKDDVCVNYPRSDLDDCSLYKVSGVLKDRAVVLKLQAGSQEAGFLSAFCLIEQFPSILIIK